MLTRFLDWLFGPSPSDVVDQRPRLKPDPQNAAELERKRASIDYVPSDGFHLDRPTCKRINMVEWRIERARRRARSAL
jgi:hypothetical protein